MESVNLKQEMDNILNSFTLDEVEINDHLFESAKKLDLSKDEFIVNIVKKSQEMSVTIANAMRIALTGKDGFKELKDFEDFIKEFCVCKSALNGVVARLLSIMSKKIENSGEVGEAFLKEKKKETVMMLSEILKSIAEGE